MNMEQRPPSLYKKSIDLNWTTKTRIGAANVEIQLILKGSSAQQKNSNARHATSLAITKPLLPEKPAKTSQLQAHETHCASIKGWDHPCT